MKQFAKSVALETLSSGWRVLPLSVSRTTLGLMKIGLEVPVEVSPRGGFCCVSVDFDATREGRLDLNRKGTNLLVELAERHEVPMTWAICGRTAEEDSLSYEKVLNSEIQHEIAVHTYSHADVTALSEEGLVSEVERCEEALGLKERPTTFIFPWNKEAHFDVLARLGFTAYRGKRRGIGTPPNTQGLWNVRPVYYFGENSFGAAPLVKRFIDLCVSTHSVFHMWLHPWSVAVPTPEDYAAAVLEPVFEYVEAMRKQGKLEVATMKDLAQCLSKTKVGGGAECWPGAGSQHGSASR